MRPIDVGCRHSSASFLSRGVAARKPLVEDGPSDTIEVSASPPSRWRDALGLALVGTGLLALQSFPWVGGVVVATGLLPLKGRLSRFLHQAGEGVQQRLAGAIAQQVESLQATYAKEPEAGPARDEYRLKRALRASQQEFGPDSIYTLSNQMGLAEHFQSQFRGIEAAQHYENALAIFESELKNRGELSSLQKLVPAALGGESKDVASLYERAGHFFANFGGAEKARPLFERALQLCPAEAGRERRSELRSELAKLLVREGRESVALPLLTESMREALEELPVHHPELAVHAEALAGLHRVLGDKDKSEDYWGLSIGLGQSQSSVGLSVLSRQYAKLGYTEQAFELRQRSEMVRLEEATSRMDAVSPQLAQDLGRLADLYRDRGDEGSRIRVLSRMAVVETRLAARGPLQM